MYDMLKPKVAGYVVHDLFPIFFATATRQKNTYYRIRNLYYNLWGLSRAIFHLPGELCECYSTQINVKL